VETTGSTGWRVVLSACTLLAVPTLVAPDSPAASLTYLAALALVVGAVWRGALQLHGTSRRPWVLLALAATAWLAGDVCQHVLSLLGRSTDEPGLPDVFWLASYPLLFCGVTRMLGVRGLRRGQRREVGLDVLVVGVAAAVSSWQLLVRPTLEAGSASLGTVVSALYPLGDVAVFAVALALVLAPGRRSTPSLLLVGCLALTLPLDCAQALLAVLTPQYDGGNLDGLLAVVNGLLGAAALHPRRGELTAPPSAGYAAPMHRWRIVLLGCSLAAVSLTSALSRGPHAVVPSLVATVVVTGAVVLRFYGVIRERDRAEAALRHQAHHDQLTGAANRTLLMHRLTEDLTTGTSSTLSLLFIDLDGFKAVNDVHGHPAGDTVLRVVTERLTALVRETDTVARVGGDEFVVLCPGTDADGTAALGRRVTDAVCRPVPLFGDHGATQVQVRASVGLLTVECGRADGRRPGAPDAGRVADDLLRSVDAAMYTAKRAGGGVRTAQPALSR
jgi:diguanylate cyclase (GGDEF)-like protein